jgi:hypothetical protein
VGWVKFAFLSVAVIGEERGRLGRFGYCRVVGMFGEREEFGPIILLVVGLGMEGGRSR